LSIIDLNAKILQFCGRIGHRATAIRLAFVLRGLAFDMRGVRKRDGRILVKKIDARKGHLRSRSEEIKLHLSQGRFRPRIVKAPIRTRGRTRAI